MLCGLVTFLDGRYVVQDCTLHCLIYGEHLTKGDPLFTPVIWLVLGMLSEAEELSIFEKFGVSQPSLSIYETIDIAMSFLRGAFVYLSRLQPITSHAEISDEG